MIIIYQETGVVNSVTLIFLTFFSDECFCCSLSSNTIILANSHQFIQRYRESQNSGQNIYRNGLSLVPSFPYSFFLSLCCFASKQKRLHRLVVSTIDFSFLTSVDRTCVPFVGDM